MSNSRRSGGSVFPPARPGRKFSGRFSRAGRLFCVMLLTSGLLAATPVVAADNHEAIAFFENKVRPLLIEQCYECHSAGQEISGGLALDSRRGWSRGGDSGPAIVPGRPGESLLMKAVRYADADYEMPPDGKLDDDAIAVLEKWISLGAPDPRVSVPVGNDEVLDSTEPISAEDLWSLQPISKPDVPQVDDLAWTAEPIDAFVRQKLDAVGLPPAPVAENRILLRRLSIDLIGLPSTHQQFDAFQAACASDRRAAISETVDRLLASPRFGQRWARHWLDLTAYADTIGVGRAIPAIEAHRYRDYVIDAFNSDKPLPEFILQQIAGDVQVPAAPGQRPSPPPTAEDIIATGFLAIGPWELVSGDKQQLRMDVVDRQVNRIGKAFLGMTLECARCHGHKFDPVSQQDYFALAGILRSSITLAGRINGVFSRINHVPLPESPEELVKRAERIRQFNAELQQAQRIAADKRDHQRTLQAEVDRLKGELSKAAETRGASSEAESKSLVSQGKPSREESLEHQVAEAEKRLAAGKAAAAEANRRVGVLNYLRPHRTGNLAIAMQDAPEAESVAINIRGNAHQLGEIVPRGFLSAVAPNDKPRLKVGTSGRRDLAEWIAHVDNPLTARVWVNRVWHHLFGVGLVRTVDNFGATGEPPSHPELLDYLASEFQKDGSTKNLIRRIVLSRTWQQSGVNSAAVAAGAGDLDPSNRLLWRAHRRRLDAEVLHDAMLLVSGQLDTGHHGGPALPLEHASNFNPGSTGIVAKDLQLPLDWKGRRAIFLPQRRADPFDEVSFVSVFDAASTNSESGMRTATSVPAQALSLVNSEFIRRQSDALAECLSKGTSAGRVRRLYRQVYGRHPSENEVALTTRLVDSIKRQLEAEPAHDAEREAWSRLCQALLMSNEFLFRT